MNEINMMKIMKMIGILEEAFAGRVREQAATGFGVTSNILQIFCDVKCKTKDFQEFRGYLRSSSTFQPFSPTASLHMGKFSRNFFA